MIAAILAAGFMVLAAAVIVSRPSSSTEPVTAEAAPAADSSTPAMIIDAFAVAEELSQRMMVFLEATPATRKTPDPAEISAAYAYGSDGIIRISQWTNEASAVAELANDPIEGALHMRCGAVAVSVAEGDDTATAMQITEQLLESKGLTCE